MKTLSEIRRDLARAEACLKQARAALPFYDLQDTPVYYLDCTKEYAQSTKRLLDGAIADLDGLILDWVVT